MDFDLQNSRVSRRTIIAAGAVGLLAAAMRPLRAKPAFEVPEVDSLSLQVIVDSATFGPFLPNLDLPGMKVLRAGNGGPPNMPRMLPRALMGEFGLSILGESQRGELRRRVVRPRTDDEARRTVAEFIKIDPTYLIPMHCTGEVFVTEALRLMPEKIVRSYVGTRFVFSANGPSSAA